jgi:hypothetical protein
MEPGEMNRFLTFSFFILGLAFAFPSAAAADTPEEFSARYLDSMRRNGMKDLATFIHPDELKNLADLVLELAEVAKAEPVPFLKPGETAEALRKLPPAEIANRFFGWLGEVAPQLTQMLRTAEAKPLGHVTDGDTVYVVAKLSFTMEGEVIQATDVLPLRRDGENYKALLKAEMTGILKAMKKAAAAKGSK